MIKLLSGVIFYVSAATATATDFTCSDIGRPEAYRPVEVGGITLCFVYTKTQQEDGQISRPPDGIAVYSISKTEKPKPIYQLPYAGTKGMIDDAFPFFVDSAQEKMLFIVHSFETPKSWDSVSDIYSVSVLRIQDGILVHDQQYSRFFDMGGDLTDDRGRITYIYPYKNRVLVEKAIRSPLFHAVNSSTSIEGTIQEKSFLYGGDAEPALQDPKKMYLIKGDRVSVEDATAGWCKVSYQSKMKLIKMWLQCNSIGFSSN